MKEDLQSQISERNHQGFKLSSVRYRIGFLLKSHLPTKNTNEPLYGCVFCIAQGHTTEEADATVFFTRDQLFAHLARHPRPLHSVPGIFVADGPDNAISTELARTWDLHFKKPPASPGLPDEVIKQISNRPSATAIETIGGSTPGFLPPDRAIVPLQFAVGARIVAIQFPHQYNGNWATGWADGKMGCFPVSAIRVDVPPSAEVKLQLSSSLVATACWRWAPKDKWGSERGKWLRLEKGETVTNICCE